jgi:hypothetical protein
MHCWASVSHTIQIEHEQNAVQFLKYLKRQIAKVFTLIQGLVLIWYLDILERMDRK